MAPEIDVDSQVYELLTEEARPFVDTTPNAVLRRLLGLDGATSENGGSAGLSPDEKPFAQKPQRQKARTRRRRRSAKRAPAGSLLPESEYETPIMQVLEEHGGRAPTREVVEGVGKILADRLTELDQAPLSSGNIRWQNRVQFTRLRMIEQGLLEKASPRGTWEISERGRQALNS